MLSQHASDVRSTGSKPRLLDQVRGTIRSRHYSRRTEDVYVHWIRRYIVHHGKRHPLQMGRGEVEVFLTALAIDQHVSASTQNQALSALLFLYKQVLHQDFGPCRTCHAPRRLNVCPWC